MEQMTYTRALHALSGQYPDTPALCYKAETAQKLTCRQLDVYSNLAAETLSQPAAEAACPSRWC